MASDLTMFKMTRADVLVLLDVLEEFHVNNGIAHEDYTEGFLTTSHALQTKLRDRYNLMAEVT